MSMQDNEQVLSPPNGTISKFNKKPVTLIIAIVILALVAALVGGYFIWNHLQQLEQARIEQALYEQQLLEQKLEEERVLYEQARNEVLTNEFYEGISIAGVAVGGMTLDDADDKLSKVIADTWSKIEYSVSLVEQTWSYTASDIGISHDLDEVMSKAWKIGRMSGLQDEKSQIFDRQQMIQKLVNEPVDLPV